MGKMKKMKHLVQAVLRWRDQRVEWTRSRGAKMTATDKVLVPHLELVASKKHNDLMLRYVPGPCCQDDLMQICAQPALVQTPQMSVASSSTSSPRSGMEEELAFLRAENAKLRSRNEMLTHEHFDVSDAASEASSHDFFAPMTFCPRTWLRYSTIHMSPLLRNFIGHHQRLLPALALDAALPVSVGSNLVEQRQHRSRLSPAVSWQEALHRRQESVVLWCPCGFPLCHLPQVLSATGV